ncbi:myosin light chain kinase family member 4 isoform X2 [Erinaceus europaeus]|uniref:Myosin light chain kinase family member 4 isoform X2 n=1 Tax=Erinaceus europaeus TaxID=9365 RepID=A0ABM3X8J2_ERIEU|nr:myosin light chain kinase family member 4 isoform X2 [Erinaceus europaeus]
MSSYNCQEEGTIKSHECVLIYKAESEGDGNHSADNNLIGLTTKVFTVKKLEEINTCYNSNGLEKMTIFQCMDKVEKVKCFLEESSSEQDSRSGKNEAKEKAWPHPNLKEIAHGKGKRTSALIDDLQAPPAPFNHRIVTAKQIAINNYYTVNRMEILGGGRFGQVHKCEEKATGLKLAAKIIKARSVKEKDEVKNEINIMNQLDHVNLIQLYDAFESKNEIILVMEYVDGGELFDRIIDDNYNLTELDTILFIKQICEGIRHMHQMYILHLDLKPENILCVNRDAKQIKIIDFGLARRYKPREKLKVNFGTPEFLAPEVVDYDFVSFSTDMWSVGIITYMLLSGLSPFLGDNDAETLTNILACRWDLEEEEFQDISDEAREFISKLLIKEKSWRISASEALKHPWLSDNKLHSRLKAERKNCRSDGQDPVTK